MGNAACRDSGTFGCVGPGADRGAEGSVDPFVNAIALRHRAVGLADMRHDHGRGMWYRRHADMWNIQNDKQHQRKANAKHGPDRYTGVGFHLHETLVRHGLVAQQVTSCRKVFILEKWAKYRFKLFLPQVLHPT